MLSPKDRGLYEDVAPERPVGVRVAIVADAPTAAEVNKRQAFSGLRGMVLDKILAATQLTRADVAIYYLKGTSVPPPGDATYHDIWGSLLADRLQEPRHRPNVIVPVGELALFALAGVRGIAKYRGSVLPSTLIPGVHHVWELRGVVHRAARRQAH